MRLGEILVGKRYATPPQVEQALQQQQGEHPRRRLGEILVEAQVVTEAMLAEALAEQFDLRFLPDLSDDLLAPELVASLTVDWARQHVILPLREDGRVWVALADPTDVGALDSVALMLGQEPTPVVVPRGVLLKAIERCYVRRGDTRRDAARASGPVRAPTASTADDLLRESSQAPVTQLVNTMLLEAVRQGASDVHVEPFENRVQIRYRVDGFLYEQSAPAKELEAPLVSRLKVMARLDIAERRLPQDGMAKVRVGEREIDIRVSTVPVAEGERVVLRLLNRDALLLPLEALGMPAAIQSRFAEKSRSPNGIILVTGPTGSGKTTTLYAALRGLDTAHVNVLTIEDPIEYQLPGIGQIQVKPKIGLTFAQGLRHILRQDPDVIFVGEIRDLETAEIAIRSALTGHLVFSTLHTNDAVSAVVRLVDMGIESYLLGEAVHAVLAQRLVRQLCPLCRVPGTWSPSELDTLGAAARAVAAQPIWRARGCPPCLGGYRGRTGVYEWLELGPELRDAIRRSAPASELRTLATRRGFQTLLHDAVSRVVAGQTTPEEIIRVLGAAERS